MTTLFDIGDAVRGHRVAITARRLGKATLVNQSGCHKANYLIARDNVHCVIEIPLTARPTKA
ncbi:hypothetical protein [Candidatus Poriferisocius sp.]|uniref:hypothetical protein n=1 Tax=Candidatus Poriferisocius sp. TaxID=3101276 RepID=UPI003B527353